MLQIRPPPSVTPHLFQRNWGGVRGIFHQRAAPEIMLARSLGVFLFLEFPDVDVSSFSFFFFPTFKFSGRGRGLIRSLFLDFLPNFLMLPIPLKMKEDIPICISWGRFAPLVLPPKSRIHETKRLFLIFTL